MTGRSEKQPDALDRIAQRVRFYRESGEHTHATLAAAMTAAGLPTKAATIGRIEAGKQPISVEQLLTLAAILTPAGLRSLLEPPFNLTPDHAITTEAGLTELLIGSGNRILTSETLDGLVLGPHDTVPVDVLLEQLVGEQPDTSGEAPTTMLDAVEGIVEQERASQVAAAANLSTEVAASASRKLWDAPVAEVVQGRFQASISALDAPPGVGTPEWRAYLVNAIRSTARDIRGHVDQHQEEK